MDKNKVPLKAQTALDYGEDLFTASSDQLLSMGEAAKICGVSYDTFRRNFWEINYKYLYPGGPRIYLRTEVDAFIEAKNK